MKVTIVCLALASMCLPGIASAEPLKIFLFTSQVRHGVVDEQLEARNESLRDLSRVLSTAKYQKTFLLVDRREQADLIVELLSRGTTSKSSSSSSTRNVAGGTASASSSSSETTRHLKFRLSIGAAVDDLTTEADVPWPQMAERASEDLAKWAARNPQRISR